MGLISGMAGGEVLRSIFGGPVSTRAICAVAVPKDEADPPPAALKHRDKHPGNGPGSGAGGKGAGAIPTAPKPKLVDPKVLRKKQIQADLDLFEDLATDGPAKLPKPKRKPVDQDIPQAAGPGPSSARLNGALKILSSSAAGRSGKGTGGGAASAPARGKAPGSWGVKPGGSQPGQRAVGTAATTAAGAKARSGMPAPATNGAGIRTAPTNHQRQGVAAATSSKPSAVAAASGRPSQQQLTGGRNMAAGGGASISGRPVNPGAVAVARPSIAAVGSRPGVPTSAAAKGVVTANGAGRGVPVSGTGTGAVGTNALKRPVVPSGGGGGGVMRRDGGGNGGLVRKPAPRRPREDEYEDDFVVDDDGEDGQDWRKFLRRTTGYDPSRYRDDPFDDRMMEVSWRQVVAEEKRSERMGRLEDEMAEAEEERHRREKLKKLKVGKKQRIE